MNKIVIKKKGAFLYETWLRDVRQNAHDNREDAERFAKLIQNHLGGTIEYQDLTVTPSTSVQLDFGNPTPEQLDKSQSAIHHAIDAITPLQQDQRSLTSQLNDLIRAANRLGLYDAADFIFKRLGNNQQ